jgi:hypothetical protein
VLQFRFGDRLGLGLGLGRCRIRWVTTTRVRDSLFELILRANLS